ncbi:MAG: hypothetical protein K8T25_04325 [Planctomycetia bacterium]|nr:hypothetical protein [Planctomycetia bacterium]
MLEPAPSPPQAKAKPTEAPQLLPGSKAGNNPPYQPGNTGYNPPGVAPYQYPGQPASAPAGVRVAPPQTVQPAVQPNSASSKQYRAQPYAPPYPVQQRAVQQRQTTNQSRTKSAANRPAAQQGQTRGTKQPSVPVQQQVTPQPQQQREMLLPGSKAPAGLFQN